MLPKLRGAFFLLVTLVLFAGILVVLAMGMVMKQGRWCERPKSLVLIRHSRSCPVDICSSC